MHPNSLANLEDRYRYQPGHLPTGGRKPGSRSLVTCLERALDMVANNVDPLTRRVEERQMADWIAIALVAKAASGDMNAIREAFDRIDGKATQRWEVKGSVAGGPPIEISGHLNEVYTGMKNALGVSVIECPPNEDIECQTQI